MTLRYICTYDRGTVVMGDAEYLRTVRRSLRALVLAAEANGLADEPAVGRAKVAESEDVLTHQRALLALIGLAKDNGLNGDVSTNGAKELIRCRVLGCGLAGACDGVGGAQYPCPLKEAPVTDLSRARDGSRVGGRIPIAVTGQTYGLITVLDRVEPDLRGDGVPARYECRCNRCGAIFVAKGSDVVHRRVRLCCQPKKRRP